MKLVILITAELDKGLIAAQAWQDAGAPGVTILETHGLYSLQEKAHAGSIEIPRMTLSMGAILSYVLTHSEKQGQLILSVVEDSLVQSIVDETQQVLGDLTEPDNGVIFILDVERAIGIVHHDKKG